MFDHGGPLAENNSKRNVNFDQNVSDRSQDIWSRKGRTRSARNKIQRKNEGCRMTIIEFETREQLMPHALTLQAEIHATVRLTVVLVTSWAQTIHYQFYCIIWATVGKRMSRDIWQPMKNDRNLEKLRPRFYKRFSYFQRLELFKNFAKFIEIFRYFQLKTRGLC